MKNFKIKNMTESSANVYIYGDIVDDGWKWFESDVTPADVKEQLDSLKGKELHFFINSGGGDVFAGTAIHNMIKRHEGKTVGHVDGVAASIASVILMACDEIEIPANAYVMIHRASGGCMGNVDDHMKMCEVLETIEDGIVETYQLHSDLDKETLHQMMADETWMTGAEFAEQFGKGVTVTDAVEAVACATDMTYRKRPDAWQAIDNKEAEEQALEAEKMALEQRKRMECEIALALS